MAAYQQRHHLLFLTRKTGKVRVLNQIGTVFVEVIMGNVQPGLMYPCCPAEQLVMPAFIQIPVGGDLLQQLQRLVLDAQRMAGVDVVAGHERRD